MSDLPALVGHNVRALCPDCHAVSTFEHRSAEREYGYVSKDARRVFNGIPYQRTIYILTR